MEKRETKIDSNKTKLGLYYVDLLLKKIDLHVDAFLQRIEARRRKDGLRVEYLEMMVLRPLDSQISFLNNKIIELWGGQND